MNAIVSLEHVSEVTWSKIVLINILYINIHLSMSIPTQHAQ